MRQSLMTVDAGVAQRRVLVAAEGEDGGVHALGVEDLQLDQQVEVRHRQARDGQEQPRLDPGADIDQRILAEIGQVHEQIGRASCRKRVCHYVYISVVAVSLKIKTKTITMSV